MPCPSFPDINIELLQLQEIESRARALHELEDSEEVNIFDRLAESCKQKIKVLQELECLTRMDESTAKLQFDIQSVLATQRIQ
jgi:hypothetical protein